jgi:hypothetical protein
MSTRNKDRIVCATGGLLTVLLIALSGCGGLGGYSNTWPYPDQIRSVYVEMFDNAGFRRGYEYALTDAICKRIEAQTPYKIISDRDKADSILSGTLTTGSAILTMDRNTGIPLEQESLVRVTFTWKNLRTGQVLINNETVAASESYSSFLEQNYDYAASAAVNKAAQRVVERMENPW